MRESDIVFEGRTFWVLRERGAFSICKKIGWASETIGEAYPDASVAIARAKCLENREMLNAKK